MNTERYDLAAPQASSLINSLRSFGYDIKTAIADIIDNSITAGALKIEIAFNADNINSPWIAVMDDGCGMDEAGLINAMRLGSTHPKAVRSAQDLGRFGLGMKTAAFSLCKRLTVITKQERTREIVTRCWDLDLVDRENDWVLLRSGSDISRELADSFLKGKTSGTIVLLENLDRLVPEEIEEDKKARYFLDSVAKAEQNIQLTFSDFMSGSCAISFYINGRLLRPLDPFMTAHRATMLQPEADFRFKGKLIRVQPYLLPHRSNLSEEEAEEGKLGAEWTDRQGFYVYRNGRLIVAGDWLIDGIFKKEQYKLARIRIDLPNDFDEEWGVDVRKSVIVPPLQVQERLIRIAKATQKESSRVFNHRGKTIRRTLKNDPTMVWREEKFQGTYRYKINRNHPVITHLIDSITDKKAARMLIHLMEETVPVSAIFSRAAQDNSESYTPFSDDQEMIANLIETAAEMYKKSGIGPREIIETLACTEPFSSYPEEISLLAERFGVLNAAG